MNILRPLIGMAVLCSLLTVDVLAQKGVSRQEVELPKERRLILEAQKGYAAFSPENTLQALKRGIYSGVDRIEFDVRMSSDGKLVVIEDATLERTTNGTGAVSSKTWEQLSALDAGRWKDVKFSGAKIPLVGDILTMGKENGSMMHLDVKVKAAVPPLIELLKTTNTGNLVVLSGDLSGKESALRSAFPGIQLLYRETVEITELSKAENTEPAFKKLLDEAFKGGYDGIILNKLWIKPSYVFHAKLKGMMVYVENVDDIRLLADLEEWKVDGISSTNPRLITDYYKKQFESEALIRKVKADHESGKGNIPVYDSETGKMTLDGKEINPPSPSENGKSKKKALKH